METDVVVEELANRRLLKVHH
ncbi:MAG: hypothetical protein RIS09_313, partial [Actinomycetota bacterium]